MSISIIILTKNEENNIRDCLESLNNFDEVIIVDDFSTDRTILVVKEFSDKIKIFKRWMNDNFAEQRNYALNLAKNDWVLFIDADERLSTSIIKEVEQKVIDSNFNGYWIKRSDYLWGKKMRHGELADIRLLRLARKNSGKWEGRVHETWKVEGKIGFLDNEIIHYPHQSVRNFLAEVNKYSSIRAKELKDKKVESGMIDIIYLPLGKFIYNYVFRMGFRDGLPGFVFTVIMSFHSFLVRSKLWHLQNVK